MEASGLPEEELARRLQRLEDREAIRGLFMDYRRCLDAKDFPSYARLFTEDGELVAGRHRARGHAEILAVLDEMLGTELGASDGDDFHVVSNISIELDGDRAAAESTWLYVVRGDDDAPRVAMLGHYADVLRREAGGWRFERRDAALDMPSPPVA